MPEKEYKEIVSRFIGNCEGVLQYIEMEPIYLKFLEITSDQETVLQTRQAFDFLKTVLSNKEVLLETSTTGTGLQGKTLTVSSNMLVDNSETTERNIQIRELFTEIKPLAMALQKQAKPQ